MLDRCPNVYQRMLARCTPCGDAPGFKNFGTLPPLAEPSAIDKATGKPVPPDSFWNGNLSVAFSDVWTTPDRNKQVYINAEQVPVPVTAEQLMYFDKPPDQEGPMGELHPITGTYLKPSFKHILAAYQPERYHTLADPVAPERNRQVIETRAQMERRLKEYRPFPTNHSTLPAHEHFIRQVVAYDVPIGFCYSGEDPDFWAQLIHAADWTLACDPYWNTGVVKEPPMPAAINTETWAEVYNKKREEDLARQGGA